MKLRVKAVSLVEASPSNETVPVLSGKLDPKSVLVTDHFPGLRAYQDGQNFERGLGNRSQRDPCYVSNTITATRSVSVYRSGAVGKLTFL